MSKPNLIPLYECRERVRIIYWGQGVSAGDAYDFVEIHGMYGLCYDDQGKVVFLSPCAMVEIKAEFMFELYKGKKAQ